MGKVTSTLGRQIQGVSQQPDRSRREGQCSKQENMFPSVVEGLKTRPGTYHISELVGLPAVVRFGTHHYVRGDEEYFMVFPTNSLPLVYDRNGVPQVVVDNCLDNSYVKSSAPDENLRAVTVGDFTFIVNNQKQVLLRSETSPSLVNEALIYVQFATYGRTYQVIVDGVLAGQFQSPDGNLPEHADEVDTSNIARRLIDGSATAQYENSFELQAFGADKVLAVLPKGATTYTGSVNQPDNIIVFPDKTHFIYNRNLIEGVYEDPYPGTSISIGFELTGLGLKDLSGFLVTQRGNVIHLRRADGGVFTIDTVDGADGKDLVALKDLITDLGKLPPYAPDGFTIKVQNSGQSDDNGFWLKAVERGGNTTKWVETIAPLTKLGYDKLTMPYVLVRESIVGGVAQFSLREGEWEDRDVGDDFSNPFPAFIDEAVPARISDLGIFQNRLYLTSGESVSMSKSGEFFNFNRTSTQTSSEDDPISGYADSNQVNSFTSTAILDGDLIYFSAAGQFKTSGVQPVNKENFTISQTTAFDINTTARPVAYGEAIFFAFNQGQFTGIREYFTDSDTDTKRARPVTEHVERYLEGKAKLMETSANNNILMVYTGSPSNVIYIYNWLWLGNEKVQSAWHKWVFKDVTNVYGMFFSSDRAYFIFGRYGKVWLEYIELNSLEDTEFGFNLSLDRKTRVLANVAGGKYRADNPFPSLSVSELLEYTAIASEGSYPELRGASIEFTADGVFAYTDEDLAGGNVSFITFGIPIEVKFSPSKPQVLDYKDRAISVDSLMLSRMYFNCDLSGELTATVSTEYGQSRTTQHTNRKIGLSDNILGYTKPSKVQHVVPIGFYSDKSTVEINTTDHAPLVLRDIEWTGQYKQRGRRI